MRAAGIHHSLKDLSEEIGQCERHLSRAMKLKDSQTIVPKKSSLSSSTIDRSNFQHTQQARTPSCHRKTNRECRSYKSSERPVKPKHDGNKNILCKETIKDRGGATQVQVVVQTKPLKRRSKSALSKSNRTGMLIETSDNESPGHNPSKSPSWSHILQQQSKIPSVLGKDRKTSGDLRASASQNNSQLESWIKAVPDNSWNKPSMESVTGNLKFSEKLDCHSLTFDPLRTLNFLVKELRGKVHKNCDENMLRIVENMEQALDSIPAENLQPSFNIHPPRAKRTESMGVAHHSTPARPTSSLSDSIEIPPVKKSHSKPVPQVEAESVGIKYLVDILTSTVAHVKSIARSSSSVADDAGTRKESQNGPSQSFSSKHNSPVLSLQSELEKNCKQLEEICRQMQDQCEMLRHQRQQALEEVQKKTVQLEAVIGKNRQLTLYSADVRQEMLRAKQAMEFVQKECDTLKNQMLQLKQEDLDSKSLVNKRLEEVMHENKRLSTELHLCQLERDKLQIFLSSKDLEVTKLKKEIVGISALVSEQLANLCAISRQNKNVLKLDDIMHNIGKFCESGDSFVKPNTNELPESGLKHVGEGEGNRTRPVCSSPTSSLNSSLYNSWQLSDISGTPSTAKKNSSGIQVENVLSMKTLDDASEKDSFSPAASSKEDVVKEKLSTNPQATSNFESNKNPADLKAELLDVFSMLKKQAAEAINVTLPSPPQRYSKVSESVEISHWSELSASESTLLNSSEDSHSD